MKKKSRSQIKIKGHKCLNCGHDLPNEENFCPSCGQVNDCRRLSIKVFLHTLLQGFYSFDSRFLRTIIPLLFSPGKVSKAYIEGKRTYYNNPFQLLLQTAIVFFIVIGLINTIKSFNSLPDETNTQNQSQLTDTIPFLQFDTDKDTFTKNYTIKLDSIFKTQNLSRKFKNKNISKSEKDSLFGQLHLTGVRFLFPEYKTDKYVVNAEKLDSFNIHFLKTTSILQKYLLVKKIDYAIDDIYFNDIHDSITKSTVNKISLGNIGKYIDFAKKNDTLTTRQALDSLKLEHSKSNIFWYQKAADLNKIMYDKQYRHTYVDGIISKTTLALFLLLPFFTLFMTLIYLKSRYNYSENLVVVFNIQTVFFILLLISVIIYNLFENRSVIVILNLAYFFYVYKTLRLLYRQGIFLTLIKFTILTLFYGFISLIGFMLISFLVFLF